MTHTSILIILMTKSIELPFSKYIQFCLPKNLKPVTNFLHILTSPWNQTMERRESTEHATHNTSKRSSHLQLSPDWWNNTRFHCNTLHKWMKLHPSVRSLGEYTHFLSSHFLIRISCPVTLPPEFRVWLSMRCLVTLFASTY